MKAVYKEFEINVKREKCLAGYDLLYYNVMRQSDGWFLEDSFEDSAETVGDKIGQLKEMIDDYLKNPKEYEDE